VVGCFFFISDTGCDYLLYGGGLVCRINRCRCLGIVLIYLSKTTQNFLRREIHAIMMRDSEKIAKMISYSIGRHVDVADVEKYLNHFLIGLNLEDLALRDYTVVYSFGILLIVDLDTASNEIRLRYGISPARQDIKFKLKKRNIHEQVKLE